jgi:UDP-glucose 4-epimerase/UDP-glucuronate decarboxylase
MSSDKRRILITGGGGFIGFHLATRLAADPVNDITLLENFARGRQDAELEALCRHPQVRLFEADLRTAHVLDSVGGDFDEVYHMAAMLGVENVLQRPVDVLRVNAIATFSLLEWFVAGGGRKLMFPSTSEVYAWTQHFHPLPIPTPEDVPLALTDLANPRSTYAGSKIFGELAVTHFCRTYQKPFVITRYHNVYGPRMGDEHVVPQLFRRASRDRENPLTVYSSSFMRAFCYVSDAVTATIACMRTPRAEGQTLNIGNDKEEVTIADVAQRILRIAGIDAKTKAKEAANDPIPRRCPDVNKARELLGYEPAVTLDAGLALTLDWYSKSFAGRAAK